MTVDLVDPAREGVLRRLFVNSLHDPITGARVKRKTDKLVIFLTKRDPITWYSLRVATSDK